MQIGQLNRRSFITLLGGAAAWPLAARAQQPRAPVVGFLHPARLDDAFAPQLAAFRRGLGDLGFAEGGNLSIEYRWANEQYERLPALAAELVQRGVSVIAVPAGTSAALAAKAATQNIPIVFNIGADPVDLGLVASLSRPGGNITGISIIQHTMTAKRLELMRDLVPKVSVMGLLVNPTNLYARSETEATQAAARTLGLQVVVVNALSVSDLDGALATVVHRQAGALLVGADVTFISWRDRFVALAASHKLPISYGYRDFPAIGGLMSYGTNRADAYRQVGIYVGRILKGENPADLPVHQPAKFELVINLKAAKSIDVDIPASLLLRADEVIE
jgi:putative tryptophan/tyrosine transport system substrate-binding protein